MSNENIHPEEMLSNDDASKPEKMRRPNMKNSTERGNVNQDNVDDDEH